MFECLAGSNITNLESWLGRDNEGIRDVFGEAGLLSLQEVSSFPLPFPGMVLIWQVQTEGEVVWMLPPRSTPQFWAWT